jgi:hypothetical protein
LGFPTGWSFTTQQATAIFWHRCRGPKKNNLPRQLHASSFFSGAVAGEEWKTSTRGVFRTHILYFVIVLLYFIFTCMFYIKNPKKK